MKRSKMPVDQYTIPALCETPREGLTPHTNLILDFFLENPHVVVTFGGMEVLQRFLNLEDGQKAWGAMYALVKRGLLERAGRMLRCHPQTAAQLEELGEERMLELLRSARVARGWYDLRAEDGGDQPGNQSIHSARLKEEEGG